MCQDESLCLLEPVRKVESPDDRFECCGERGWTLGTTTLRFAFAEEECVVEAHPLGHICKSNPTHNGCATLREITLARARICVIQRGTHHSPKEGVSEKLQPLVVFMRTGLMTPRRVREGEPN
jgi:hypothetical protein